MEHPKRYTVLALSGGLLLAVGIGRYVEYAVCHTTSSLLHAPSNPAVFYAQLAPYLLCAALWLPWRSRQAANVGAIVSGLLFAATVVLYVPALLAPGLGFCDWGGVIYGMTSMLASLVLLLGSMIALTKL